MDTKELLKKIRKIEIKTRGLSNQIFSGEYHSAFKGRGMAFSEVREYMPGDEIRTIDWNVTARLNHPYVKVFQEERELSVMLLVDVSKSESFGTQHQIKRDLITEICAVLSFSAIQNNDKIGVIFFSDKVEKFIPPKKGKTHVLRVIRELIEFNPEHSGTNLSEALRFLTNAIKKRSIAFVISDFIDENNYADALKIANKKHDVVAINVYDKAEENFPNAGLVQLYDAETGELVWIDTSSPAFSQQLEKEFLKRKYETETIFKKAGVDYTYIGTHENYVKPLMNLFKRRELRR
ncbi:MAG: DUF58 domain-containing protein [Bacteroidetes bacterium]|nr:MAG: DUF58 domain-containing protein [Bacteroidota bacterium]